MFWNDIGRQTQYIHQTKHKLIDIPRKMHQIWNNTRRFVTLTRRNVINSNQLITTFKWIHFFQNILWITSLFRPMNAVCQFNYVLFDEYADIYILRLTSILRRDMVFFRCAIKLRQLLIKFHYKWHSLQCIKAEYFPFILQSAFVFETVNKWH